MLHDICDGIDLWIDTIGPRRYTSTSSILMHPEDDPDLKRIMKDSCITLNVMPNTSLPIFRQ